MGFAAHLKELRNRVTIALLAICVFAIAGFFVADYILELLARPLDELSERGYTVNLNITKVTESFNLKMMIGFVIGIVAASPIWLYETIAFFIPGLKKRERRYLLGFIISSIPLFLLGCATGWFVLPRIILIFVGFAPDVTTQFLGAQEYFSFSLKLGPGRRRGIPHAGRSRHAELRRLPVCQVDHQGLALGGHPDRPVRGHDDPGRRDHVDGDPRRSDPRPLLPGGRHRVSE